MDLSVLYQELQSGGHKAVILIPSHIVESQDLQQVPDEEKEYTERGSKIGFGLEPKLSRINDRKSVNIRNIDRLTIIDPRGFRQAENPIFEPRSV